MTEKQEYKVLARKYRPAHFDDMIGQDALVKTLKNALDSGRLHHAYMLHGIRGVGKTTTARIMARALNYGDKDAKPTSEFKDLTDQCKMIIEGRHVDVIEMDAASNTGVDNIRDIIDSVQYAPALARFKVYIIDEVHMLSKSAFNALLKTLEEPPAHVKFIFATTEIRKVPVTVLSRCQRFDLKRIDQNLLQDYYKEIVGKENAEAEDDALALIARAADGSARDGLSLLDQAISLGDGKVTVEQVRNMLGLADQSKLLDLFDFCLTGQAKDALNLVQDLYKSGADPLIILQDLLYVTHLMTKAKTIPSFADDINLSEAERSKNEALAHKLTVPILTRTWQILMKGLAEIQQAPNPQSALEMILMRLLYSADMPTPGDLAKLIKNGKINLGDTGEGEKKKPSVTTTTSHVQTEHGTLQVIETHPIEDVDTTPNPQNFEQIVALFDQNREILIASNLKSFVRLVSFKPGTLEINLLENAMEGLPGELKKNLQNWTGVNWQIIVSNKEGDATLSEKAEAAHQDLLHKTREHPDVQAILNAFPDAYVHDVIKLNK